MPFPFSVRDEDREILPILLPPPRPANRSPQAPQAHAQVKQRPQAGPARQQPVEIIPEPDEMIQTHDTPSFRAFCNMDKATPACFAACR